ncbi:MAG: 1-acyl-sn-glycerol-3-phosphate acyltransferase [Caldanaerobacter subterraneus]|jgi:1-acyl-sn-glycerol-3-phosphate acyltransferase|uniref:1-acyl-sn-glycerol-3-phosphate acyltransferase n=3 Tax=Caldanaerobacter subterraneus TaxID=911092 RepID=Q8RA77_CALS4|nr:MULTISPECIES: lysophospholipid acyltransferase family protein [Caldanaerobacter]AAM24573.1 1-acyl-sn-glycerol-3-phosphate acyltransferase [Caldanaerobacter subterraneus subsp. tengcongensis MB4]KKC29675.1 1-acyl-sn-glycerol-3-phosphate acyltransferase [Caldanaerobacter subterraneus subsp. pacificus DSM 12653]KUK09667.1 MAG: 1-acyl-sn-glycerol-3-phosphate acyltransferase [Caldanaerobacter subterraneus]MCS3915864.1 1-acyl-sn-glycerol-3-phosphate acyltransferase [Caldanaerobacter subterraneus s
MFYYFAKVIVRAIVKVIFRIKVKGLENIPKKGPVIICPNHISLLDPPVVGALLNRRIYFMAKEELFRNPFLKLLLGTGLGAFPVKRGTADLSAIKTALNHLKKGRAVGIFPEGTRSKTGKLQRAEPGVAMLAIKSKAPVVPVGIKGRYGLFSRVIINIGKPMTFEKYYDSKLSSQQLAEIGEEIMKEIAKLI